MSNIKNKKIKNNINKLLKQFQNAKSVICQKLNSTFEKTIQSEMRNDNEKVLKYELNGNNAVDYTTLIKRKTNTK